MRNLVLFTVQELQTYTPENCHGCRELHHQLKEALMQYLLSATWLHEHNAAAATLRAKQLESGLSRVLTEFHEHRRDTHFGEYIPAPWTETPIRNAS